MTLIAIALFGLLFVAIFGAKAAQGVLKFIGVLFALFVCAVVLTVVVNANRVPAPPASPAAVVPNAPVDESSVDACVRRWGLPREECALYVSASGRH